MADVYYRENPTNGFLIALVVIAVIAAVAFGVYYFSGSSTHNTTRINNTRIEMPKPDLNVPKPTVPTPARTP